MAILKFAGSDGCKMLYQVPADANDVVIAYKEFCAAKKAAKLRHSKGVDAYLIKKVDERVAAARGAPKRAQKFLQSPEGRRALIIAAYRDYNRGLALIGAKWVVDIQKSSGDLATIDKQELVTSLMDIYDDLGFGWGRDKKLERRMKTQIVLWSSGFLDACTRRYYG